MIQRGLHDDHISQAAKLSLVQRARRILLSKSSLSRKRKSSNRDANHLIIKDVKLGSFTLEDFPEINIIQAPEVNMDKN